LGHDLGGSVIKRALILATESPWYRRVAWSTRAFFFFAGLRHPDKNGRWERHLTRLLSVLKKNSDEVFGKIHTVPAALRTLAEDFINISGSYDMFNIYEKSEPNKKLQEDAEDMS
jgi:hypothetical protein